MINFFTGYFGRSIKHMIMISFVCVLLIPLGFSITSLFQNSWSQAQQNMLEKHKLIAETLVEPFTLFISSRQKSLNTLGNEILVVHAGQSPSFINQEKQIELYKKNIQSVIDKYFHSFDDLAAVSFVSAEKNIKLVSNNTQINKEFSFPEYSQLSMTFIKSGNIEYNGDLLSSAFTSQFNNKPVVLLSHFIKDKYNNSIGVIRAEVSLKYIESMCSKINFGVKGHCATVDQTGSVVAHPNKEWIKEIRELSKISVVKKMMAGLSGTTEFYSPFLKADMVAGYSAIPALGWGVMIPQPKSELTQSFNTIKTQTYLWLFAGIVAALFIAYLLMNKIISPINNLIYRTREVGSGEDYIGLGPVPKHSPREIKHLWRSFAILLAGLQKSNKKITKLNESLENDIKEATKKLRDANKNLYELSNKDYLTSISNRRYFDTHLQKVLQEKNKEYVGILVMDIDNFKEINDVYGHEAGDLALQHLSQVLTESTRAEDLAARSGGDEFVVYVKNMSDEEIKGLAERIRATVENRNVELDEGAISLTISLGIINHIKGNRDDINLKALMLNADRAMYVSKQNGRNQVTFHEETVELAMNLPA